MWDITSSVTTGSNTVHVDFAPPVSVWLDMHDISVVIGDPLAAPPGSTPDPPPTGAVRSYGVRAPQMIDMAVTLNAQGNISIDVGAEEFNLTSYTSQPSGDLGTDRERRELDDRRSWRYRVDVVEWYRIQCQSAGDSVRRPRTRGRHSLEYQSVHGWSNIQDNHESSFHLTRASDKVSRESGVRHEPE